MTKQRYKLFMLTSILAAMLLGSQVANADQNTVYKIVSQQKTNSVSQVETDLSQTQGAIDTQAEVVAQSQAAVDTAQAELDTWQKAVDTASQSATSTTPAPATSSPAGQQEKIKAAQTAVAEAQTAKDTAQSQLDSSQKQLASATDVVTKATTERDNAQKELSQAESSANTQELTKAQAAVQTAQSDVDKAQKDYQAKQDGAAKTASTLKNLQSQATTSNTPVKNTFTVTADYIKYLQQYWDTKTTSSEHKEAEKKLAAINDSVKALNTFKATPGDENIQINPNQMTQAQREELTFFAQDLINQLRHQFGTIEVIVTDDSIKYANKVARGYQADNWAFGKGHDINAINRPLEDFGIKTSRNSAGQYSGNFNENLHSQSPAMTTMTMARAKQFVYESMLGFMFNGREWEHARSISGVDTKKPKWNPYIVVASAEYLGVDFSTVSSGTHSHFLMVTDDQTSGSRFNTTPKKAPSVSSSTSANQSAIDAAKKANDEANKAVTTAKANLDKATSALTSAKATVERLLQSNSKVRLAKTKLTKAQASLDTAVANQKTAQANYQTAQASLSQADAKLTQAKNALNQLTATNKPLVTVPTSSNFLVLQNNLNIAKQNLAITQKDLESETAILNDLKAQATLLTNLVNTLKSNNNQSVTYTLNYMISDSRPFIKDGKSSQRLALQKQLIAAIDAYQKSSSQADYAKVSTLAKQLLAFK